MSLSRTTPDDDDVISSMPENVVSNILDRLPIQDAVGTSILSKTWRFKWTLLTQLIFDYEKDYDEGDINRLLLQLKGPITNFDLCIPDDTVLDVKSINHWVMFLSGKGIQEFTLTNNHETSLRLPTHLFSCMELKHLTLSNCCFRITPSFCGFPNLLTLHFFQITFESGNCGQLITQCPLLENLEISYRHDLSRKLKLAEIAKLKNLIVLSLPLCNLDYKVITLSKIHQLVSCFPRLQELCLDFQNCKFPTESNENDCLIFNSFPSLKTLTLSQINLGRHVVFISCMGSQYEIYLIKHLLACSPLLKKMAIHSVSSMSYAGKLKVATTLLKLNRASHTAIVDFN
uniref:F-box/FBD/LRR-repeat protein At1g13570-like n=1 Tax=Erigeron canadensis TaxID=72917 RepID=UPI001CB88F53|nr:F-box/FBD/LRR-repeat protein At1g13570-like [Erigeron canadensis]